MTVVRRPRRARRQPRGAPARRAPGGRSGGRRRPTRSRPATPPPTGPRRCCTGSPRPVACNALPALPAAAPPFYRPLLDVTRDEVRAELRAARDAVARRRVERRSGLRAQPHPHRGADRACSATQPALPTPTSPAPPRSPRPSASCSRRLAAPFVDAAGGADLAFRTGTSALQREVVRRAAAAAGVTRAARRRRGADRAGRRQPAHAAGWRRGHRGAEVGSDSPPQARVSGDEWHRPGRPRRRDPDRPRDAAGPCRRARRPDHPRLRRRSAAAGVRAEGRVRVRRRPGARHRPARPRRLHGDLVRTAPARRRRGSCGS